MKVLVTGANGFLGSHLVDRLLERGDEVHVLIRKTSNLRWLMAKRIQYHYGDVSDLVRDSKTIPKGLREGLKGADVLFHVAGVIRAPKPRVYYEVNAQGTDRLLASCLHLNPSFKRVVVVTSLAAHGPGVDDGSFAPATEEDECHPLTDYGKSKRDAELIALKYADRLPISIIRPPAIYGPRDDQVLNFFKMIKQGIVFLPGLGRQVLNLAHVQDVVTGLVLAAEHPKAVGEIFYVGEDRNYDWEEVVDIVARAMHGPKPLKVRVPKAVVFGVAGLAEFFTRLTGKVLPLSLAYARNFTQRNWALDISKAKRVLGFQPAFSLEKGVKDTYTWYKNEDWI